MLRFPPPPHWQAGRTPLQTAETAELQAKIEAIQTEQQRLERIAELQAEVAGPGSNHAP